LHMVECLRSTSLSGLSPSKGVVAPTPLVGGVPCLSHAFDVATRARPVATECHGEHALLVPVQAGVGRAETRVELLIDGDHRVAIKVLLVRRANTIWGKFIMHLVKVRVLQELLLAI
jgi:hypothetical protein